MGDDSSVHYTRELSAPFPLPFLSPPYRNFSQAMSIYQGLGSWSCFWNEIGSGFRNVVGSGFRNMIGSGSRFFSRVVSGSSFFSEVDSDPFFSRISVLDPIFSRRANPNPGKTHPDPKSFDCPWLTLRIGTYSDIWVCTENWTKYKMLGFSFNS